MLDKADPTALKRDLESYISSRFATIRQKPVFRLESSWPGNELIKELAENAFPLFIFPQPLVISSVKVRGAQGNALMTLFGITRAKSF